MAELWYFVRSLLTNRRLNGAFVLVLGLAGTVIYSNAVSVVNPVQDWLFWVMLKLWFWLVLFTLGSMNFGQFVIVRLLRLDKLPALESAFLSIVSGTIAFGLGMYLGGAFGHFTAGFAVGLPLVMACIGAYDGYTLLRRVRAEVAAARYNWLTWAITGYGIIFLGLVYLGVMAPNISVDASMVHLKIAEDYARTGRLIPFVANYQTCVPHLASILYTWAFIVPGFQAAQHWMLALHLEFCLFVVTLVGVAAAIRRMVGDFRLRAAWVAIFLFPGFFAADSNLEGCADHVVASFSVAIVLATLHLCKRFSWSNCVLLGISFAGALLTKYQSVYLIASTSIVVALAWLMCWYKEIRRGLPDLTLSHRRELLWAPAIVIATTAALVSPHFIKNAVFYHNPVFPFMEATFRGSRPQFPNASFYVAHLFADQNWVPQGTLLEKLKYASKLFLTFSFSPHYFLNNTPYFGSLFTLLLPAILVVQNRRNTARVAVIGAGSLFLWCMIFNVDRNLQTFMPVLACVTGALIFKLWHLGWLARAGLIPLVAFQVVWASDLPLFDSRGERIKNAMDLIASGIDGRAKTRFDDYRRLYVDLGAAVPESSRLLLHLGYDALGINREVWLDRPGFQGQISYQNVHTARELFDYYRSMGITHVILDAREDHAAAEQDEILIRILIRRNAVSMGLFGSYHLFALPKSPPRAERPYQVLALGASAYPPGLYPIENLGNIEYLGGEFKKYGPPAQAATAENAASLLTSADVVLMRKDYPASEQFRAAINARYELIDNWKEELALYVRRRQ